MQRAGAQAIEEWAGARPSRAKWDVAPAGQRARAKTDLVRGAVR
jgi:hypothetical protein